VAFVLQELFEVIKIKNEVRVFSFYLTSGNLGVVLSIVVVDSANTFATNLRRLGTFLQCFVIVLFNKVETLMRWVVFGEISVVHFFTLGFHEALGELSWPHAHVH